MSVTEEQASSARSVLVTGAAGFIGSGLVAALAERPGGLERVIAMDVRAVPRAQRLTGVHHVEADIVGEVVAFVGFGDFLIIVSFYLDGIAPWRSLSCFSRNVSGAN